MEQSISRRTIVKAVLAAPLIASSLARAAEAGGPYKMRLCGFSDEISPNFDEQLRVCKELGVRFIEMRAVDGKGVLDLDESKRKETLAKLKDNGMGVASIGSPLGKVKITDPWPAQFDRVKLAVDLAVFFSAPVIRIFSYYAPSKTDDIAKYRDEVIKRMQAKADYAKDYPVTFVHENEHAIYGEKGPGCLDILKTVNSPKLRCCFDFANFGQAGDDTLKDWEMLKPYIAHFHIKDYKKETKKVVPAGQGDMNLQAILEDAGKAGYHNFLSLEPHLKKANASSGETGPDLFKVAADALRELCRKANITLE